MHSHQSVVAIAIVGHKFKFTSPEGQSMEAELESGQAMYLDAVNHATENTGPAAAHVVMVE